MNLKRLTKSKYLLRTFLIAALGGAIIGLVIIFFSQGAACTMTITTVAAGLLGVIISSMNYRKFVMPMRAIIGDLELVMNKSNIKDVRLETIEDIREGFFGMLGGLADKIEDRTVRLTTSINQLSAGSQETAAGANEIALTSSQLASTVQQTAQNAGVIHEKTDAAALEAKKGWNDLQKVGRQMETISDSAHSMDEVISSLGSSSDKISVIVETITNIANQTNLLALNAAIEAARAGDQGRGFAVVAEEVRKLAEESAEATQEVKELITNIQDQSENALKTAKVVAGEVQQGVDIVTDVNHVFEQILRNIEGLAGQADEIASGTELISSSIQEVAAITEEATAHTEEIASSSRAIAEMVLELEQMAVGLKQFKLETGPKKAEGAAI